MCASSVVALQSDVESEPNRLAADALHLLAFEGLFTYDVKRPDHTIVNAGQHNDYGRSAGRCRRAHDR